MNKILNGVNEVVRHINSLLLQGGHEKDNFDLNLILPDYEYSTRDMVARFVHDQYTKLQWIVTVVLSDDGCKPTTLAFSGLPKNREVTTFDLPSLASDESENHRVLGNSVLPAKQISQGKEQQIFLGLVDDLYAYVLDYAVSPNNDRKKLFEVEFEAYIKDWVIPIGYNKTVLIERVVARLKEQNQWSVVKSEPASDYHSLGEIYIKFVR